MMTITIDFKSGRELTLKNIDSCYLGEDNTWRFFCDLKDREIIGDAHMSGIEIDEDTVFVLHDTIESISFK